MMKLLLHMFLVIQTIQFGLSQVMRMGCTDLSCPPMWSCIGSTCIGKYHECAPGDVCPTDNECHNGRCFDVRNNCGAYNSCSNGRICVLGRCRGKRLCTSDADCIFRNGNRPYRCCRGVCMRPCGTYPINYNCRGTTVCIDGVCVNDKWSPNAITEFTCA